MAQDAYRIKIEIEGYQQDTFDAFAYYLSISNTCKTLRYANSTAAIFEGDNEP
ncbi:MAG: hypothetical protein R2795_01220 [Saprospiraceae bacterium]